MMIFKDSVKEGFDKVASIIDANPNYHTIMGKRLRKQDYTSISNGMNQVLVADAFSFLSRNINEKPVFKFDFKTKFSNLNVIAYGSTLNNKREFEYLEQEVRDFGIDFNIVNIEGAERVRVKVVNADLISVLTESLSSFLKDRKFISVSLLHQLLLYSQYVLSAYETLKSVGAKVLVVANDHSPVPVAFTVVAHSLGIKTFYMQHAEITSSFPRLTFDYSLLRNKISKSTYSQKGLSGTVVYSDRSGSNFNSVEVVRRVESVRLSKSVDVVIYPSSIFDEGELDELISCLLLNCGVKSIFVKLHPAVKKEKYKLVSGVSFSYEIPEYSHVAICGNSSVVVELVAKGNLVFNYFYLDDIEDDYYGFVRNELATKIEKNDLLSNFWYGIKSDNLLVNLADYIPSVYSVENNVESFKYKEMLIDVFFDGCIERKKKIWFERDLFAFTDTFLRVLRSGKGVPYNGFWIVKELNRFFDERDPRINELFDKVDFNVCKSVLEFWLNTKSMEWNGRTPTESQLENHLEFVTTLMCDKKLKGWLELKCFDIALRFGSVKQVLIFLKAFTILDVYKIGINKKISYLNFIAANPSAREQLNSFYDFEKDRNLVELDRLKIKIQVDDEFSSVFNFGDFREVERNFLLAHPVISSEYDKEVKSVYDILNERACFVDVKRNKDERESFLNLIKIKLKAREGFSFIRLSDGEGFIFKNLSSFFTEEDSKNRQRHWWGEEITIGVIDGLRSDLLEAVRNADVLGIPSVYRFVRDHSVRTNSLTQSLQGRGLISVLNGVKHIDTPDKIYTDDKANIAIFNELDVIIELARQAVKVVIVNSGSSVAVMKAFSGLFCFEHIQVPTHCKTTLNTNYYSSGKTLPYVYREVAAQIEATTTPGTLVLVGAGVAGKVFMQAAKRNGGVALDLGSAMDQFLNGGIHSLF